MKEKFDPENEDNQYRRKKNIVFYSEKQPEEVTDMYQFFSMVCGVVSFMMKLKPGIWLSLLFLICSWLNAKKSQEQKNFFMNFSMIMMGFTMTYFGPKPPQTKQN